ncbi:DUF4491 family protein [bacterium]|nr:DUF4491 family protein [bacterium]
MTLNPWGLIIGAVSLLAIGFGHVWVIKGEYHFGTKIWPIPLILGVGFIVASLLVESVIWSAVFAVNGTALLWGIGELFHQRKRVEKGWYPKKPEKSDSK